MTTTPATTLATPATTAATIPTLNIDFVSDVSCPWCAVGLASLEQAIARLDGQIKVDMQFQPFELNPRMPAEGQEVGEHLTAKYGSTLAQQEAIRENIRLRGEEVGFTFRREGRGRIYNTFDAHRLLHWVAHEHGNTAQHGLKKAFLEAYFTHGQSPGSHEVLLKVVGEQGLDVARAAAILACDEFTSEVRTAQSMFTEAGINSVPAVIVNRQHLISGGQPVDVFENALRQIAAGQVKAA